jgi:hypothetical protein
MVSVKFDVIKLKAKRTFTDSSGKKRQLTKTFSQTVNPWNKNKNGTIKDRSQIISELETEIAAWMKLPDFVIAREAEQ